uniref:HECT domain-containing protein n=1 Tax=Haemonchus placei TaxID=6290 RepID=A0A0N4X369_HAEPC
LAWPVSEALASFELLFRRALQCLPNEDVEAQRRFRFRDDSLSCVIGRLIIRCTKQFFFLPRYTYNVATQFERVGIPQNHDHHHFAWGNGFPGVDVMRIDESRGETATDHINFMSKLFSDGELKMMR